MAEERERQFKYRWDRTWADVPEEYLAFDGDVKIGCVHRLNSISAGGWYWAMNAAPNGLARSAAQSKAATKPCKEVEREYDAMVARIAAAKAKGQL